MGEINACKSGFAVAAATQSIFQTAVCGTEWLGRDLSRQATELETRWRDHTRRAFTTYKKKPVAVIR
jgi:hypothetical protein